MLVIFDFEADSEYLMLWILGLSFVISDVFAETINTGLVLDENFNRLFPLEFNSFD